MKMKKFAALAAATVMSVSAIAATSAFGVFATTDAGVNNIVIKDSDTNRVYKAYPEQEPLSQQACKLSDHQCP